jgi:hypothetical protein
MQSRTWKETLLSDTAILVWMGTALVILHCLTNNQYGFHRDELNFIEDGRHLAWGYIDCQPFTPFMAAIAERLFGTSLVGIRFFPAVSQGLVLVLTGLMVRRMGGNRWAQVIAAAGAAISGVSLSQGSIFMYVSFDFLWWVVVAYGVISLLKTGNARWWLAIGAAIGLGMMTKLTMIYLVAGLVAGVMFTPARRYLKNPWLWAGAALALLIFLPNFLWMVQHDFISLQKLSYIHARDVRDGFYKWFLLEQLYSAANPSSIFLWPMGLYFFWRSVREPNYRPGGTYYLGERVRNLERAQRNGWNSWVYPSLIIGGLCAASIAVPVMPVNSFWWKVADSNHQLFSEEIGWPELVKTVADIRDTVPLEERARLGILAYNYGEAGAINVYGPAYNLPHAISGMDSFWLWGYGDPPPETVIVVGLNTSYAYTLFETCSLAGKNTNSYGIQNIESRYAPFILLCRHLRQPWEQFWKDFRSFG